MKCHVLGGDVRSPCLERRIVAKEGLQQSNNRLQRLICVSSLGLVTLLSSVLQDPENFDMICGSFFGLIGNRLTFLFFTYNLCSCAPGELVVVEHAVLDRCLAVHLVNVVVREPDQTLAVNSQDSFEDFVVMMGSFHCCRDIG